MQGYDGLTGARASLNEQEFIFGSDELVLLCLNGRHDWSQLLPARPGQDLDERWVGFVASTWLDQVVENIDQLSGVDVEATLEPHLRPWAVERNGDLGAPVDHQ